MAKSLPSPTGYSLATIPVPVITRVCVDNALIVKLPSASALVQIFVPFTLTVANGTGRPPWSVTLPVTTISDCANAIEPKSTSTPNSDRNFLM